MGRVSLGSVGEDCLHCQKALITLHNGKALTRSGVPGPHVLCTVNIATAATTLQISTAWTPALLVTRTTVACRYWRDASCD